MFMCIFNAWPVNDIPCYSTHAGKEYDTVFEFIVESLSAETPSVVLGAMLV
jgi:hypothetical protein